MSPHMHVPYNWVIIASRIKEQCDPGLSRPVEGHAATKGLSDASLVLKGMSEISP